MAAKNESSDSESNSGSDSGKVTISPVAYTLYLLGATAFIFFGAMSVAASNAQAVDRVLGTILIVVGAAFGLMAGRSRAGDVRFQRALVALSMTVTLLTLALTILNLHAVVLLIASLLTMGGGIIVFRANSETWFPPKSSE